MKHNKRMKTLTAIALILSLAFSMSAVWAVSGTPRDIQPRTIIGTTKTFEAVSSTKAYAEIMASTSGMSSYITSKITLQSAPLGSTNFTNDKNASPATFTVYDTVAISHSTYFAITSSKDYRVKYEVSDNVNGMPITGVYYKTLDR